jgi:hypothetical protein
VTNKKKFIFVNSPFFFTNTQYKLHMKIIIKKNYLEGSRKLVLPSIIVLKIQTDRSKTNVIARKSLYTDQRQHQRHTIIIPWLKKGAILPLYKFIWKRTEHIQLYLFKSKHCVINRGGRVIVFNITFNNISAVSWLSV